MTILIIAANIITFYFVNIHLNLESIINTYGFIPSHFSLLTVFTNMFLHQNLMHLIGNMWFLWLFGENIEDKFGKLAFLLFYIAGGFASMLLHSLLVSESMMNIPCIGASGAISAVMGAYVIMFPRVNIRTFIWFIFFITSVRIPAFLFLFIWFFFQFLSASQVSGEISNIAYWAHIGGFIFGVIIGLLYRVQFIFSKEEEEI